VAALTAPGRPAPAARAWLVAGLAVPVLGALAPLAVRGGGAGHVSLAVLIVLVGVCLWAGAFSLLGGRGALLATVVGVAALTMIALPVTPSVPFRWRQALYRTDQTLQARVPVDPRRLPAAPALRVLAEPHLTSAQPAFLLATETPAGATRWECPFAAGRQWLVLPLAPSALVGVTELPVALRLAGQPNRDGDYLMVYSRAEGGNFLVELADATTGDTATPSITCQAQPPTGALPV